MKCIYFVRSLDNSTSLDLLILISITRIHIREDPKWFLLSLSSSVGQALVWALSHTQAYNQGNFSLERIRNMLLEVLVGYSFLSLSSTQARLLYGTKKNDFAEAYHDEIINLLS